MAKEDEELENRTNNQNITSQNPGISRTTGDEVTPEQVEEEEEESSSD